MLIVTGTFKLAAEDIDKMKDAAAIMGRATRDEPGCITYAFWQSVEDGTEFRVYEEWQDQAALDAHVQAAHMAVFRATLATANVLSREVVKFPTGQVTPL